MRTKRQRRRRGDPGTAIDGGRYAGGGTASVPFTPLSASAHYEYAANRQLDNAQFDGALGWTTTGDVSFADGAATLTESATSQTRLNQVFVLGQYDHVLSFTLSPLSSVLGPLSANGPDDAFEVALIDANSGLEFSGRIGKIFLAADGEGKKLTAKNTTNVIPASELANWKKAGQPLIDGWIADVSAKGANGRQLYDAARALIAKHQSGK